MAPYALAGTSSLPDSRPAIGVAVAGPAPTPDPLATERILPVIPELAVLFPGGGLPRGGTVLLGPSMTPQRLESSGLGRSGPTPAEAGRVPGLTSLLLLLLAGTSSFGYWCAVAGLPELGFAAAAELGVNLDRLVVIPHPGAEGRWQSVVATLLETVDLVCLAPEVPVRPADARKLVARARERCSTLLVLDPSVPSGVARGLLTGGTVRSGRVMTCWPGPSDLRCAVRESSWSGLDRGYGRLSLRKLEAEVGGRGAATRPRRGLLRLPA